MTRPVVGDPRSLGSGARRLLLGFLLLATATILGFAPASPAAAQSTEDYLPEGASVKPGSQWDPPANGQYFEKDQWDRITGAYGCVAFSQLPPSANTICGYIDIWPKSAPPGVTPPSGQRWMCLPGINILPYSVPFNKGSCGFFSSSSPPQNAFVPTAAQTAAAQAFLQPFRADSDKDTVPDIRDNCPNKPNVDQWDVSDDGVGDACDRTPLNAEQLTFLRKAYTQAELEANAGARLKEYAALIRKVKLESRKRALREKQEALANLMQKRAEQRIQEDLWERLWGQLNLPKGPKAEGAKLRAGQLLNMWGFVKDLRSLSDYPKVAVQKADAYYQTSEGRSKLNHLSQLSFNKNYAQLTAEQRKDIATQAQTLTGAYRPLLQRAGAAGTSAAEVVTGQSF